VRICREASAKAAETMVALLDDDDGRIRLLAADKFSNGRGANRAK
jgi:hypothetical protein